MACPNTEIKEQSIYELIDDKTGFISESFNEKFDSYKLSDGYVIAKYDSTAEDLLKIDACKKYAKF